MPELDLDALEIDILTRSPLITPIDRSVVSMVAMARYCSDTMSQEPLRTHYTRIAYLGHVYIEYRKVHCPDIVGYYVELCRAASIKED